MEILITGGLGFVGFNLAKYFASKDNHILIMDNLVRRGSEINLETIAEHKNITFIHGDVRNKEDFDQIGRVQSGKSLDVICECAAQPSAIDGYENPLFDISNNTVGALNSLEYARMKDAIFIFWATNKCYAGEKINSIPKKEDETRWKWDVEEIERSKLVLQGFDPTYGFNAEFSIDGKDHSIYGLSKVMADLAVQEWADAYGVRGVSNRFSCLAGEGQFGKSTQGWVSWWPIAFEFNLPLTYIGWKGKQVRDILFIEDICRLVEMEIVNIDKIAGRTFNVGGGNKNTLSLVEATYFLGKKYKSLPEILYLEDSRKADHCVYISDNRPLEKIGWQPTVDIPNGYERIIKWVKNNRERLRRLYL